MDLRPPRPVVDITRRLEDAGFETWAVGGAVRDAVLGQEGTDWDLATRARPEQVRALFRRTIPIGIEHGTVGVLVDHVLYEVTTFRRDVETFGRHAVVEFAETIDDDLARRDFTINALAWHPLRGELRDPFGGERDLRAKLLRTVGVASDRYAEDYLRVLRGLRLAGQLDLRIDEDTWRALVAATPHLAQLSAERIREELWKVFTKSRMPSRALALYADAGVLRELYPELEALVGIEAPDAAADQWTATLRAVDALPPTRPLLRLAALLHRAGVPAARTKDLRGGWRIVGHEVGGARVAEQVLRRLKASNAQIERVARLVRHQSDLFPPDATDVTVRRWLRAIGPDLVRDLFRLRIAIARATADPATHAPDLVQRWRHARRVLRARPPLELGDLAIDGRDLMAAGVPAGPELGRTLRELLERVVETPELNQRESLLALVREEIAR